MGAREGWLIAVGDQAMLVEENDGARYLRRGSERSQEPVRITKIEVKEPWSSIEYQAKGYSGALPVTRAEAERWQQWVSAHTPDTAN
jgi:hypothetical protein